MSAGKPDWKPLLESVSLPAEESFLRQYPRALSVGLAQRFLIAMALLHHPAFVVGGRVDQCAGYDYAGGDFGVVQAAESASGELRCCISLMIWLRWLRFVIELRSCTKARLWSAIRWMRCF